MRVIGELTSVVALWTSETFLPTCQFVRFAVNVWDFAYVPVCKVLADVVVLFFELCCSGSRTVIVLVWFVIFWLMYLFFITISTVIATQSVYIFVTLMEERQYRSIAIPESDHLIG